MNDTDYANQFKKAKVFDKGDFARNQQIGGLVGVLIGFAVSAFGVAGLATGDDESWKYIAGGVFAMVCAVCYLCFPGFRKIFDGGSTEDHFEKEFDRLADAWESSGVVPRGGVENTEEIAFYGKPNGMALFAIIPTRASSAAPDAEKGEYLFAHYNALRPKRGRKPKDNYWAALSRKFEGTPEELIQYLESLNQSVIAGMADLAIEHNRRTMPDPLDLQPLKDLACVPVNS